MPTYTYRCESCGIRFERYQKFEDQPLTWCPECNKKTLRKVYSPVGIVFKGSGFYSTDNRSPSGQGRNGSSAEKSAEAKAEAKAESKTESKEESKTESKPGENAAPVPKSDHKSD